MGSVRGCDARCHEAKHARCECWCGGLFHGAAGAAAREAFREVFGEEIPEKGEPAQPELFQSADRFSRAWRAAVLKHPRFAKWTNGES